MNDQTKTVAASRQPSIVIVYRILSVIECVTMEGQERLLRIAKWKTADRLRMVADGIRRGRTLWQNQQDRHGGT